MTATVATCASLPTWHQIFDQFVQPSPTEWTPRADVSETEQGLSLQFDLPGITREGLDIRLENSTLTIKGERKLSAAPASYHRVERPHGSFNRVFSLPENVSGEGIRATMADGVLSLFLPRREESKPRQIQVQVEAAAQAA